MFTKLHNITKTVLLLIIILMSMAGMIALLLAALGYEGPLNISF